MNTSRTTKTTESIILDIAASCFNSFVTLIPIQVLQQNTLLCKGLLGFVFSRFWVYGGRGGRGCFVEACL